MTNQPHIPEDTGIEARTRAAFAASVEGLNGATRSKLTQARYAALEELKSPRAGQWRRAWLPVSGVAAAAVLAIWLSVGPLGGDAQAPDGGALPLEALDIVAQSADMELLQDVEFYAWIAQVSATDSDHTG